MSFSSFYRHDGLFAAKANPFSKSGYILKSVWLSIALASLLRTCAAQEPALRMDQIVQSYVDNKQFMGAVLVAENGKVVLSKGYGSANIEWNIPDSSSTKFRLGSITKQFTAASILLLEERGKLKTDDPIKKYMQDAPAAWDKVTIFNLLTHTSGIPSFTDFPDYSTTEAIPTIPEKLVGRFRDKPLSFTPGEKWAYSNSGYVLLGYLLEKISGQSYRDFVQENIFKPLGMDDSGYDSNSAIMPRRASGYSPSQNGPVHAGYIDMTIPFSAGALYSTTEDLLRWEQGLFGGKVLSAASLKKMTTAFKNDYAFGLAVSSVNGHALIEHGGGIEGFNTQLSYYPDDKLTVIVLGNLNGSAPGEIARKLARFCVPALVRKPIADTEPQVTTLVRTTLDDLAANKPNLDSFVPDQRDVWAPERIKGLSAFVKSLGALKSIDLLERKEDKGSRLYTYRAEFADHAMLVDLTLDRDSKINAFRVHLE